MKKPLLSIIFLFLVNFVFAQETDSTRVKKTTKTTTTTTTTTVVSEPIDSVKKAKKIEQVVAREEFTDKRNVIKTNLTSFFISTVHLSYERVINERMTFQVGVYYAFPNNSRLFTFDFSGSTYELRGFGITPEIKFFPNKIAPKGFFIALSPRFQYNIERRVSEQRVVLSQVESAGLGMAVIVGQQWLVGESISLELFAGPSVNGIISKKASDNQNLITNSPYPRPIGFRFGFNVGFAF